MLVSPASVNFQNSRGFIVIEGVNGAGKGSLIQSALKYFAQQKIEIINTHEPGSTELGQALRKILLQNVGAVDPLAELLLFAADRAAHVSKVIKPAIAEKRLIISDRYYYSTEAFQGFGRGLDLSVIKQLNELATAGVRPDLTVLLDLDPRLGLERTRKREENKSGSNDGIEAEKLSFHERVRNGFLEIANQSAEQFLVVDASRPPTAVYNDVLPVLEEWVKACKKRN